MFGWGKEKLTEKLHVKIIYEIGMFQSWTIKYRHHDLNPTEIEIIVRGILERENIKHGEAEVRSTSLMALANQDFALMDHLREKYKFDLNVQGFCKSIGLSEKYYIPKQ